MKQHLNFDPLENNDMFPDSLFGIPKVQTEEDFLWVTEEEHDTIKTIQMTEKKKTKTYKQAKPSKPNAEESELRLAAGLIQEQEISSESECMDHRLSSIKSHDCPQ